jgi:hypothetical protein
MAKQLLMSLSFWDKYNSKPAMSAVVSVAKFDYMIYAGKSSVILTRNPPSSTLHQFIQKKKH